MRITVNQLRRIIKEELERSYRRGALDEGLFGLGGLFGKGGPLRAEPADPISGSEKKNALDPSVPKEIWLGLIQDPDLPGGAGFDAEGNPKPEADYSMGKKRRQAMQDYMKWHQKSYPGSKNYKPFSEYLIDMKNIEKAKKSKEGLAKRDAERRERDKELSAQYARDDRASWMQADRNRIERERGSGY